MPCIKQQRQGAWEPFFFLFFFKTNMAGLIRRAPLAFFSFLDELLQGPADDTNDKKDDILMFMMLEEFIKKL